MVSSTRREQHGGLVDCRRLHRLRCGSVSTTYFSHPFCIVLLRLMSSRTAPGCEFNNACTRSLCASMVLPNLVAHLFSLSPRVPGFAGRLHPQQRHRRREHLRREGQSTRSAHAKSHTRMMRTLPLWTPPCSVLEFDLGLTRAFSAVRFLFRCQFPDENFRLKHAGQLPMQQSQLAFAHL